MAASLNGGRLPARAAARVGPMASPKRLESIGARPGVQVISRVGHILRALAADPAGLSLAEVVVRTRLPKSTAYRLLLALEQEDLVASVDGRFRIGRALNGGAMPWYDELRRRARPLMEHLAVQVQETVDLGVLVGNRIMFIEQVRWNRELTVGAIVGELYVAHASALGKALLAGSVDHQALTLDKPLERLTDSTVVDAEALARELAVIAGEKLAYDREEFHPGVAGLATYALTGDGSPVAIGIVVPSARFDARLGTLRKRLLANRAEFQRVVKPS